MLEPLISECNTPTIDLPMARDLQPWFPPRATPAGPPTPPWNPFRGPKTADSFLVDASTDETVAYLNSLLATADAEPSSQPSAAHDEEEPPPKREARRQRRPGLASGGSDDDDDDEEQRPGKRHHSKNLVAERKRRQRIRDRLHALRSMVPKITKMDKASILGDAIEYVKELQNQVRDMQEELEKNEEEEDQGTVPVPDGMIDRGKEPASDEDDDEEQRQMEVSSIAFLGATGTSSSMRPGLGGFCCVGFEQPQVEVKQLTANELFLMVLCEHRQGGFARLMEAMNALSLEVTNASVTTSRTVVLNVFRVEKGNNNSVVRAEEVRDMLLQTARGRKDCTSDGGWG
ncbi:Helix-loop-helix DNA-binding domain [Musa troglodytarum]|uniref:Helix-loop-helix DNA-binding domain n=1 Tax=Musa troglodytarum TaxID=320322 RepID=A0A9E7FE38_9LILI|nr:Helix-loop-helix DNA-binding domain [Musa troglodytarum]